MEVIYERCCGLDVHKRTVAACLLTPGPEGERRQETRTFGTMTDDLLALADWLAEAGCTHVAMDATGAYWKPIHNILEGQFELLVVNAQHVKAVTGREPGFARGTLRTVGQAISLFLTFGFLIMLGDQRKMTIHDHMAGTIVVRTTGGRR